MRSAVLLTIAILASCGGHVHAREAEIRDSVVAEKSDKAREPASRPVTRLRQPVSEQGPAPEADR